MSLRAAIVVLVFAGCASEAPSLDAWRGQYKVDSSTCTFIDTAATLRLHEREPGMIALDTFNGPDAWVPVDAVNLAVDGDGLSGSAVTLLCGPPCTSCVREIRYARDEVHRTASAIHLELARASNDAAEATCTEDNAWALATSAVTCTVDATYYAPDRI